MSDVSGAAETAGGAIGGAGRKVHGFPVWAWAVLVVVGGYMLYSWYRKSSAGSQVAAGSTGLGAVASTGSTGQSPAASGFSTNQAWMNAGVAEYGSGANTPLSVTSALSDFLNGNPLSVAQQGIVNQVIGGLGAAPQSAPPPVLDPAAAPAPTPSAAPVLTVWQQEATGLLNGVFGGNFTNATSQMGGDPNSSQATAVNTWAGRLAGGETPAQAVAQMQSGPTYTNYKKTAA